MDKITRRVLLFGGLIAVFNKNRIAGAIGRAVGACEAPEVDEQTLNKYPSSQARFPDAAYRDTYGDRQYTLIGDSNHTDRRIYKYFFSDRNINLMAQSGIKNLCLERDQAKQPLIDQLQDGKISPDEFAAEYFPKGVDLEARPRLAQRRKLFTQALVKMGNLGIKVHLVDEYIRKQDIVDEVEQMHEDTCNSDLPISDGIYATYAVSNLWDIITGRKDVVDANRSRRDDRDRTALIQEKCGNEPSVVIFGKDHFARHGSSIKSLLGAENVRHIEVVGSKAYYDNSSTSKPDYVHFVANQEMHEHVETAPLYAPAPEPKPTR